MKLRKKQAKIIFEDGTIIKDCFFFGYPKNIIANFIFNTSLTGYQEVLTDPSYNQEAVVLTFPEIGIYGINPFDNESDKIHLSALIVHKYQDSYDNCFAKMSLNEFLIKNEVPGVENVDTRALTKFLTKNGSTRGAVVFAEENDQEWLSKIRNTVEKDHIQQVSGHDWKVFNKNGSKHLIFYDFGFKDNIKELFIEYDYKLTIVPWNTKYSEFSDLEYDGIFLSNGPGNPEDLKDVVNELKLMIKNGEKIIGICLGHQLLGLANDAKIMKLKFGHHGTNHPVKDLLNNRNLITSQNHNYAIIPNSIKAPLKVSFISLNDQSIEGIVSPQIYSVQFHPEASPGPIDAKYIFEQFNNFLWVDNE